MSAPWMPLYVADYRKDTAHLSAAEHGAYLLLIMHYWATGGLPEDDRQLCRIACMTSQEWKRSRQTIEAFFEPGWRHGRIDRELTLSETKHRNRAEAGRRGGKAKAEGKQTPSNATAGPEPGSTTHNHTQTKEAKASLERTARAPPRNSPRKSRMPEGFSLTDELLRIALEEGRTHEEARRDFDDFAGYCAAHGTLYVDWVAAWRNWVRKAAGGFGQLRGPGSNGHGPQAGSRLDAYRRAGARVPDAPDVSRERLDLRDH